VVSCRLSLRYAHKKMTDIKTTAAIFGTIIGVLGFLYGLMKDRKLREIEKRAKGPHFVPQYLAIDANGKSIPQGGKPYYHYRKEAVGLKGHLFEMEPYEESVPPDYPKNRVVALVVKNEGSKIRFFKIECKENLLAMESNRSANFYEFRYLLEDLDKNEQFKVTLKYETEAGARDKQVWLFGKGKLTAKRIKPISI